MSQSVKHAFHDQKKDVTGLFCSTLAGQGEYIAEHIGLLKVACHFSVIVGLLCCITFSFLWLSPAIMDQPDDASSYATGVLLFCIGALVELLTEPLVILGQAHQYVTTKVRGVRDQCQYHIMYC